jgi:hypothetical protein
MKIFNYAVRARFLPYFVINTWQLSECTQKEIISCTYLLNKRRTTQMMINISAITMRIRIMVGLTGLMLGRGSCFGTVEGWKLVKYQHNFILNYSPTHSTIPSFFQSGTFSNLQMQRPSRHSVCGTESWHCSLKKQLSFTDTAAEKRRKLINIFVINDF